MGKFLSVMWNKGKDCQRQSLSFFTKWMRWPENRISILRIKTQNGFGKFSRDVTFLLEGDFLLDVTRSQVPPRRVLGGGSLENFRNPPRIRAWGVCSESLHLTIYIIRLALNTGFDTACLSGWHTHMTHFGVYHLVCLFSIWPGQGFYVDLFFIDGFPSE